MKLFDLYATLGLDAKAFNQGISTAKSTFRSFSGSISTGIGSVGRGVSGALHTVANGAVQLTNTVQSAVKGTLTAFAGLTSALTVTGIKYNSMMENYTMDFTTLLQDAEKAAAKVEELRKLDLSTPLDFETLASATKMMLNFGIAEEEAGSKLLQLSDIAMGNKEKFDSLTLAFSQIRSVGKLTMMDLRQMANQGFNPLQIVAEETGVAIGDLQEYMSYGKPSADMEKAIKKANEEVKKMGDNASIGAKMLHSMGEEGQISADIVAQAIDIATSEGGRFYKATENAAKTLSGQWSMLQGGIKKLIGSGFDPLSKALTEDILPNLNEFVDDLDTAYNTRGGGNSGLVGMLEVARDELYKIRDSSDDIGENLARSIRQGMHTGALGIKTINGILPDLMQIGREAFDAFRTGFKDNVTQLSKTAELISPDLIAGAIGIKGDFLVAGLDILGGIARGISNDFSAGGEGKIGEAINAGFQKVADWCSDENNMSSVGNAAKNILISLKDGIVTHAETILSGVVPELARVMFGDKFGDWVKKVFFPSTTLGQTLNMTDENVASGLLSAYEVAPGSTHENKVQWVNSMYSSITGAEGQAAREQLEEINSLLDELDGKRSNAYVTTHYSENYTYQKLPNAIAGTQVNGNAGIFENQSHYIKGFDTGLDFVPYDNFLARLHKGEQVLTKAEAAQYRKGDRFGDMVAFETQSQQPVMVNIDGDALVAAITRKMTRSIGNRNLQQLLAMGG